jgi:hypothetical protein
MSFFDIPPAAIDRAALEAFLAERLPESLNLDYKRELSESVFETIAAMANTYGGIVLVGVGEDPDETERPLLSPAGVEPSVRERLVNQSYTRFQPPFAPDVVPVPLDDGKVVLVVRVDPRRADRPIVLTRGDNHKIPIRLEARNAPADRYRMAELFAESAVGQAAITGPANWAPESGGTYPLDDRSRPALLIRVALEARIPTDRLDTAMIETEDRRALATALEQSQLSHWLSMQVGKWTRSWSSSPWETSEQRYSNRSAMATLQRRSWLDTGLLAPFIGQASLLLPTGMHVHFGKLALLLDVAYDPYAIFKSEPEKAPRLSVEDIFRLLRALLDTALDTTAPAVFPRILGVPVWERIGPVAYIRTPQLPGSDPQSGVGYFIDVDPYVGSTTPPNLELVAADFAVPRSFDIGEPERRGEVARQWLTRLFLDMGLERFEDELDTLN